MNVIVDYGVGNLLSLRKALEHLGQKASVSSRPEDIAQAERIILPGVGSFGTAARNLTASAMEEVIREKAGRGTPLLGICLGLQMLFEESEENEGAAGLGIFRGRVKRLPASVKVPHLGWNRIYGKKSSGFPDGRFFYFVHSYYCDTESQETVKFEVRYGISFPAVIQSGSVTGVQFHPEKSGEDGLEYLRRWLRC